MRTIHLRELIHWKGIARPSQKLQRQALAILSLAVPLGVVVATAFLPLTTFVRQAFIGIILIWLYAAFLFGSHLLS